MSNDVVIKIENLSKRYIIGHQQQERYRTLRDTMTNKIKEVGKRLLHPFLSSSGQLLMGLSTTEELWALKDVSFEVKQGERIGIIGRNGAGKTTLLKLISQITEPTVGRISIKGRVASLLEVGTGFHPELTGRENIYLNGAILGMSKADIKNRFDEIVAFAEVEKFLDTPVKRYSSGMYVRLAFAVAAHLEPEILLVDEVLAVGDLQFQKKCLGKMEEIGKEGRTILFVSHNMAVINNLCISSIFLKSGSICKTGPTNIVIQDYLSQTDKINNNFTTSNEVIVIDSDIDVLKFHVCDTKGEPKNYFKTSENIKIIIKYNLKRKLPGLRVGIDFFNLSDGEILFRSFDDDIIFPSREAGHKETTCLIPANLLKPGTYVVKLQIGIHNFRWIVNNSVMLKLSVEFVDGVNSLYADSRPGKIMPKINWNQINNK